MKKKLAIHSRRGVVNILLAGLVLGLVVPSAYAQTGPDSYKPQAKFDWSIAERYVDRNGDGLRDPMRSVSDVAERYTVTLDACATVRPASGSEVTYSWSLPVTPVSGSNCMFTAKFSNEGTYAVELLAEASKGSDSITKTITIRDHVIASLGDSYSSGEGNPHVRQNGWVSQDQWEDIQCHRSAKSGTAQYAAALEEQSQKSVVTFIHLACSGADSKVGLREPYAGQEPVVAKSSRDCFDEEHDAGVDGCSYTRQLGPVPSQISALSNLLGGTTPRRVDQLLLTIGGNDIGFGDLVRECAYPFRSCGGQRDTEKMKQRFGVWGCSRSSDGTESWPIRSDYSVNKMEKCLPGRMQLLAKSLDAIPRIVADQNVYLLEYGDPTRNRLGGYCEDLVYDHVGEIDAKESKWASEFVLPGLNNALKQAAGSQGWNWVEGYLAATRDGHGVCADERSWFVSINQSLAAQGNVFGFLHPNEPGQVAYGQQVVNHVQKKGLLAPTPEVTVTGVRSNKEHAPGVVPVIEVNDYQQNRSRTILLDGKPYTSGTAITEPGLYTLRVIVSDPGGPVWLYMPFTVKDPNAVSPEEPPSGQRWVALIAPSQKSKKGDVVRLTGAIDGTAACVSKQTVRLKARVPGNPFKTIATGQSDESGNFTFAFKVARTRDYKAVVPVSSNGSCLKASSAIVQVKVASPYH